VEAWFEEVTSYVALAIEAVAVLVIAYGSVVAIVDIVRMLAEGATGNEHKRAVWLRYAGWLVAGLTFQLAADILRTTIAPTWDDIGRVAAIAVIRTFLTYFLDRDVEQMHEEMKSA
jgi:uncharacterized membrane protein